jgi:hypothetical protein
MTIRSGVGGEVELDSPGGGLRLDFGRHLAHGFWLLGTFSWSHIGAAEIEACADCARPDAADSLVTGFVLRYTFPFPDVEMYLQAGPGFLIDIVGRRGGEGDDARTGFHQQAAFLGSLGLGYEIAPDFVLGFRVDTLLGSDLDALSLSGYAGYRFEWHE